MWQDGTIIILQSEKKTVCFLMWIPWFLSQWNEHCLGLLRTLYDSNFSSGIYFTKGVKSFFWVSTQISVAYIRSKNDCVLIKHVCDSSDYDLFLLHLPLNVTSKRTGTDARCKISSLSEKQVCSLNSKFKFLTWKKKRFWTLQLNFELSLWLCSSWVVDTATISP